MPIVANKFKNYQVNIHSEILILGTFSHNIVDGADFFYGKPRNFLWHLLPISFGLTSLKEADIAAKKIFMTKYKIDFADVIETLNVPEGEENNLDDTFIDTHAFEWKNINSLINTLPHLKAVYFTRKTFNGINNAKQQITQIAKHCLQKNIRFCKLETPAKYFDDTKQKQWIDTIVKQTTCMRA
jgi:G:T/U-mismatch repair DNA glycosylase